MINLHSLLAGLKTLFKSPTYGETLEQYIVSNYPKDSSDVDRLTLEWQRSQTRERLI
jgi:hypothetical protein